MGIVTKKIAKYSYAAQMYKCEAILGIIRLKIISELNINLFKSIYIDKINLTDQKILRKVITIEKTKENVDKTSMPKTKEIQHKN